MTNDEKFLTVREALEAAGCVPSGDGTAACCRCRALDALIQIEADHARMTAALDWCSKDWPHIEFSSGHVDVMRLEPGQGEERVFGGATFLDAIEKAMKAPPFTGETIPEYRDRQQKENAALRVQVEHIAKSIEEADVTISELITDPAAIIMVTKRLLAEYFRKRTIIAPEEVSA